MLAGIVSCLAAGISRKRKFAANILLITVKSLSRRITGRSATFNCFGQNNCLHNFSSGNNDFELLGFSLRLNVFLRNRSRVIIHINKFNFCFLEEIINYYLVIVKGNRIRLLDFQHRSHMGLFESYLHLIEMANEYLHKYKIEIEISPGEFLILNNLFCSLGNKMGDLNSHRFGINKLFGLFDEIKKMPHSFLMTIRYFSLLSEEVIIGPRQVVLDILHKCNTDCIHCWIHSPSARKLLTKEFISLEMDLERVKSVVDDCVEMGVDTITLLGDGEPVLNSDFLGMLSYIKKRNQHIGVITFSNGLAMTPAMSNELVKLGLNEIWFSVPAATASTYRKICPSKSEKDFERIKKNISYLCNLKNKLKGIDRYCGLLKTQELNRRESSARSFPPYCIIAFVLHNANFNEITQMAKMAVELGADEMRFQLIHLDKDNKFLQLDQAQVDYLNEKLEEVRNLAEKNSIVLSSILNFQLSHMHIPNGDWSRDYYLEKGCPVGFFFSIIKANGDVGLCCSLKVIDNLKNRSFKDIWLSQEYRKARIGAKYLRDNKDMRFLATNYHKDEERGDLLYSERCEYCDNHDMNSEIINLLLKTGLFDLFMRK